MLTVLCSGTLVADPKSRTGASGKPFCTALIRVPVEDADAILVSAIAFAEQLIAALLALGKGDALVIAGRASLRTWEKDGETKHGLSVVADQVLTAYAVEKKRRAACAVETEREIHA